MRECVTCHGEGGYWTYDENLRDWEFSVCEDCRGTGEVKDAVPQTVAE